MRKLRGFTIVEVLIAMAIIGLLAAIALPSYRQSIRKANRSDAHITMSRLATLQERYFFQNNQYTGDFADIITGAVSGATFPTDEGHYSILLNVLGGGTGWSMIATPVGDQANDSECVTLTLTSLGAKTALDVGGNPSMNCW